MTLISGPLSTVTTTPSAVAQVNISINSPRTRGAGVMTPEVKTVAVTGGAFSSQIAPGPAVLSLLIGGRESAPIPILVDDVESQTLAEVVDAARLATGQTQESLAQFVQQVLSARSDVLDAVAGFGQVGEDALTAIGVEVTKAEDAATSAEADATQTGLDRQAAAQSADEAATHEDTSLDAAAAAIAAAVSVAQFQGHGSPNGKVAAPVGSIYTDLDATAGAIRWIKTSGTGNTGWQVEYGDTGWRDISENIQSEWTGWARVKRETHQVRVIAYLTPTENLIGKSRSVRRRLLALPPGFYSNGFLSYRAPGNGAQNGTLVPIDMGYLTNMIDISNADLDLGNWTGSNFTLSHTFAVDSPWPTTLPGTPV